MPKKKHNLAFLSFKPKSNSIYLAIVVFDKEQNVLLTPYQQYPILPIFTRDRLSYHNFTVNNPDFHSVLQWCQQDNNNHQQFEYENDFLNKFVSTHNKLMQLIGCCNNQKGLLYRHIIEFQRPTFKLLFMLYPFNQLNTNIISPLSRTSRLNWYPSHNQEHLDFITKYELVTSPSSLTTKLWRQPRAIYNALCSQLPRGLYLALFYCQSSPSNCRRGLQIYLEKNHEHLLPCVPLRHDTSITANEWEWLQNFGRKRNNHHQQQQNHEDEVQVFDHDKNTSTFDINLDENQYHLSHNIGCLENYDFLTKEMQEKQQLEQQKRQEQLIPFQQAIQLGCDDLQSLTGINIEMDDLFTEDSLCLIYDHDDVENKSGIDIDHINDNDYNNNRRTVSIITDNDDDDDDIDSLDMLQKTLKKKTLSIADMFTYGQKQIQQSWSKPVHVRMLVIVKPLCLTPDFPVRPNFDFYPYRLFKSLYQDKLQFATTSSEPPIPRKKPHHHVSMSDLLNSSIKNSTHMISGHPHHFVQHQSHQQYSINSNNNNSGRSINNDNCSNNINDSDTNNSNDNIDSDSNDISSNNNSINDINPSIISYQIKYTSQHDKSLIQSNIIEQKKTDIIYKNNDMDFSMTILYHENDLKGWTGRLLEFDRQRVKQRQQQQHQLLLRKKSILHSDTSTVTTNASVPIMTTSIKPKQRKHSRMNSTCSLPIDFVHPNLIKTNTMYQQKQQQLNYFFDSDTKSLSKLLKQWWVSYRRK